MLHWRWTLTLRFPFASAIVPGCFLGKPPHCSSCGECTLSCGAIMRRRHEFCDRRGLFALDCRTDGRLDDIARRYGPCLPCLDLLSGKHAARLNS